MAGGASYGLDPQGPGTQGGQFELETDIHQVPFDAVRELADRITYLELNVVPSYMEEYTAALFLPHTDLSRFPSAGRQP